MWQQQMKMGMKSFIDGDNEDAIRCWKNALAIAATTQEQPSAALAEVYYCLGKALSDARNNNDAVGYLQSAVQMLSRCDGADQQKLKLAQYELAEVLTRLGAHEQATAQFQQAYDMPAAVPIATIPLKKAIKELQQCKLARDLKGGVLTNLCQRLDIDVDGDNEEIATLLVSYYLDEQHGLKRCTQDKFFVEHYTEFVAEEVVARLESLAGCGTLLTLTEQIGETADGDFITLSFRRYDGEMVYRGCSSVVGLVDEFSDQLAYAGSPYRCCSLDNLNSCFAGYVLEIPVQRKLHEANALVFDELYE